MPLKYSDKLKYRDKLKNIIKHCTGIISASYLYIETPDGYELEITAYDTIRKMDFNACSNVYCTVTSCDRSYYDFYIDMYNDKFALCQFGGVEGCWYIQVDDFKPFYPLTHESFFQMQLIYDLKDLTFEECNDIMHLCVQIPNYEEFI